MINDDSYHTPAETRRYLLDRLLPGLLVAFRPRLIYITVKARQKAVRNQYSDQDWIDSSQETIRLLEKCGARFHVTGVEYLRKARKPMVIISNHMSTLETLAFPGLIAPHMKLTFVVKDGLVKDYLFGPVMRSRNPIVVSRHNSREDLMEVLTKGQKLLSEGCSVAIFPQSTRRLDVKPEEFNSLGVKLASRAGVQVVPVAIKTDFWKNGKPIKELGRLDRKQDVHIRFGEPMDIKGSGKEENQEIIKFIQDNLNRWRS